MIWKVKCERLVDHVYAVFAFGSEDWSWTQRTMEKFIGWETKTMTRLFRVERQKKRDVGRLQHKNVQYGQEDVGADGPALSV